MADTILVRGEGGSIFEMSLPLHEAIADKLRRGQITEVDGKGAKVQTPSEGVPGLPTERPSLKAHKAEWVGWAVAQGMKPDDAEAASKTDLVEKYATD